MMIALMLWATVTLTIGTGNFVSKLLRLSTTALTLLRMGTSIGALTNYTLTKCGAHQTSEGLNLNTKDKDRLRRKSMIQNG